MFSTALKIDQLNDFLNLSEECVLPVNKDVKTYEVKLRNNATRHSTSSTKKVLVGLSDCMTCSGCLTSSEDVILRNRGYEDIAKKLESEQWAVVSIAPQTAFMFAAVYRVSYQTAFRRLSYLLRKLGAKKVYDMQLADAVAVQQAILEFKRYVDISGSNLDGQNSSTITACTVAGNHSFNSTAHVASINRQLPIITSHCPGWTTYAEKNLGPNVVSKISNKSSSQQIQGMLIKTLGRILDTSKLKKSTVVGHAFNGGYHGLENWSISTDMPTKIYHVVTAPCYDKKVEAMRHQGVDLKKLYNRMGITVDAEVFVDDVLSTSDLQKIMELYNIDFDTLPEMDLDPVFTQDHAAIFSQMFGKMFGTDVHVPEPYTYIRPSLKYSQSGGFAQELKQFAKKYLGIPDAEFEETINPDYREATLRSGNRIMKFVLAYGFRNVQNMLQKIKKQEDCQIAYIEVMACPGGCFNGAGQVLIPPEKPRGLPYIGKLLDMFRGQNDVEPAKLASALYHESSDYVCTDQRTDVVAITNTVIPTFSSYVGTDIVGTRFESTDPGQKSSVAALKW
ncbi:cytosolic Fe-S cluster assembly factor narfl [Babesia ovis]|uniref:Cytosolic Fe-S cluster assembly factor narfl n=1 Tax=Babesia ovis TaxID=5869 RepID=A0A9W5WWM2_BABOV|nr:cytosolic Fe-S cluster assembly factor narfl [Babesia ovis]